MLNNDNKYKKVICKYWKEGKCKNDKLNCKFAHGQNDITKNECLFGIYCYNEGCEYIHNKDWNPYINKKECNFCLRGFCNKEDIKYKHKYDNINIIKNDEKVNKRKIEVKENFLNNEEFPDLNKIYKNNIDDNIIKKNEIKVENKDELTTIKKELYNEYKYLSKLDPKSWSDDMDIEETKDKINLLKYKYSKIKEKYKKDEIFDSYLNLNILEMESNNENNSKVEIVEPILPNVQLTINGIDINEDHYENKINKNYNNDDEILSILNNMENENIKYISNIKYLLDNNHAEINNQKEQLNKIIAGIYLLKLNYYDILK